MNILGYCYNLFLRGLATLSDVVIFMALGLLVFSVLMGSGMEVSWTLVPIGSLLVFAWILFEARDGRTPGKQVMGLNLELGTNYSERFFKLLLRNFAKWGLLGSGFWVALMMQAWIKPDGIWSVFAAPQLWIGMSFLAGLCWQIALDTERLPHDWISESRVLHEKSTRQILAPLLNFVFIFFVSCIGGSMVLSYAFYNRPEGSTKISTVKANMHTLQTIVETYAVDWGGLYPENLEVLRTEANLSGRAYWKDFMNPFTSKSGYQESYTDYLLVTPESASSSKAGLVLYKPVWLEPGKTGYVIYGLDKSGRYIRDKGQDFVLTNS